ncbi:Beta-lactamase-like [Syntrophomonas zehnderi OL-4]|uniref:Beta-lactamase-like n=1 Tax=Syntrophomonas zehnderi OL-4 TaxID=690567 RepID=A0A0E4GBH9_9FIRM|nr:MBL fold metallo-hydrolase [Syntrophomonas zehnderi]CFX86268.1 Beta-lactamase-like [Syntrophomonas zehnderi OL-4]
MNKKTIFGIILGVLLLGGCSNLLLSDSYAPESQPALSEPQSALSDDGLLKVHYIDVGQGDAILIQTPAAENILIDGGGNDDERLICDYLASQEVKKIDVLVGTHPHEDHIGGLDAVVNHFPVENVYLPRVTHNTKTYEDLLQAIKGRGLKVKTAQAGVTIPVTNLNCQILSPARSYENLNDFSAVIKLDYGQQSFLFCGDATETAELDMLAAGYNLQSDIIKIGHHGSISSSSRRFLKSVAPVYAVISCGQDNAYGHPHKEVLARLKKADINVLRTDKQGTIVVFADGKNNIEIKTNSKENGE